MTTVIPSGLYIVTVGTIVGVLVSLKTQPANAYAQ